MIESFRLPDLVLGVSIRADTAGASKAANDLQKSLGKNLGKSTGEGGEKLGENMLGGFTKALRKIKMQMALAFGVFAFLFHRLLGRVGSFLSSSLAAASAYIRTSGGGTGMFPDFNRNLDRTRKSIEGIRQQFGLMLIAVYRLDMGLGIIPEILGRISGMFRAMAENTIGRAVLVTVALTAIAAVLALIITLALGVAAAIAFMAGVTVTTGLMVLLAVFAGLLALFVQVFAVLSTIGIIVGKIKGTMPKTAMEAFWMGIKFLTDKLPGTGKGWDLGGPTATRMAGATLEGSADAYRILTGTWMRYQGEIARNTKNMADNLQKIVNRGPDMGVVTG